MSETHEILVVDDEPTVLAVARAWLTEGGYQVRCANDGDAAMSAIKTECPDILITDWKMPRIDGIELCRWLRGEDLPKEVYILFLTFRREVEAVVEALSAGADDFLSKPVCQSELLARVQLASRRLDAGATPSR